MRNDLERLSSSTKRVWLRETNRCRGRKAESSKEEAIGRIFSWFGSVLTTHLPVLEPDQLVNHYWVNYVYVHAYLQPPICDGLMSETLTEPGSADSAADFRLSRDSRPACFCNRSLLSQKQRYTQTWYYSLGPSAYYSSRRSQSRSPRTKTRTAHCKDKHGRR